MIFHNREAVWCSSSAHRASESASIDPFSPSPPDRTATDRRWPGILWTGLCEGLAPYGRTLFDSSTPAPPPQDFSQRLTRPGCGSSGKSFQNAAPATACRVFSRMAGTPSVKGVPDRWKLQDRSDPSRKADGDVDPQGSSDTIGIFDRGLEIDSAGCPAAARCEEALDHSQQPHGDNCRRQAGQPKPNGMNSQRKK